MTFIDTNLTYSQQVCDYAVGGIVAGGAVLFYLGRLLVYLLAFYIVYRVTEIFIRKYKHDNKEKMKNGSKKK
jgi:hypothetical protein